MNEVTGADRKKLGWELVIVLALSLGASACYSLVSFLGLITSTRGIAGSSTTINQTLSQREWLDLTYQLLGLAGRAPPVAPACLPPLRLRDAAARGLPRMRHARLPSRLRTGRGADRR